MEKKTNQACNTIPDSWIDRLFERLELIYKDRWIKIYSKPSDQPMFKTWWKTALSGLSANEIKTALTLCECFSYGSPPTPIEFFHYSKRLRHPPVVKQEDINRTRGNPDVARKYLDEIKSKVHNKSCLNANT